MTTAAFVKRLVKPLLERHADLALVGRWIFVKPVHHFARGILIGPTPNPKSFSLEWAAVHLFEPRRTFPLNWGGYAFDWSAPPPENLDDLPEAEKSTIVNAAIERNMLPELRAMRTFNDYLAFVAQSEFRHQLFDSPSAKVIVDIALGNLDTARAICRDNVQRWPLDNPGYDDDDRAKYRGLLNLCALLTTGDRSGLARILHDWEAFTVRNFKIEHLWERTPFPLELSG
jgi:hypothetical protein